MDSRKVVKSLLAKGFQESDNDHKYFTLYIDGNKTSVYTKVSHGASEIADPILTCMQKQMRLSKREFQSFVDCHLSKDGYANLIQERHLGR